MNKNSFLFMLVFTLLLSMSIWRCGSDDTASTSAVLGTLNSAAWVSGRIVYADNAQNKLVTVTADGTTKEDLIVATGAACPNISSDGNVLGFSMQDTSELVVITKSTGAVSRFQGAGGKVAPFRIALNDDGSKIVYQDPDSASFTNVCGPISLIHGGKAGTDLAKVTSATGTTVCAEYPEWSPDGTNIVYLHVDTSLTPQAKMCYLVGSSAAANGCTTGYALSGHKTWSPDNALVMGMRFLTYKVSDDSEVFDPYDEVTGAGATHTASGELETAILAAASTAGYSITLTGQGSDVRPISLNWNVSDNKLLVFDAYATGAAGEGVHIFTYNFATDAATHIAGPFTEADTNTHNYSKLCPRWIP